MAPNSLFAILLRSRWWISFVLCAAVVLLALALLPADYKLVGALGAVPFFAIGVIALVRQLNAPSPAHAARLLEAAGSQNWAQFAQTLQAAWRAEGYTITRLGTDSSADFRLERQGKTAVVCAKRWKAVNHGTEPLKQLEALRAAQGASDAVYIALHPLPESAAAFARGCSMVVLQGADLAGLLARAPKGS